MKQDLIGIITIYDPSNYGNRLQNFALAKYIEMCGFKAETLLIDRNNATIGATMAERVIRRLRTYWFYDKTISRLFGRLAGLVKKKCVISRKIHNARAERLHQGEKFDARNLSNRKVTNSEFASAEYWKQYRKLIVGSDQVWNPFYCEAGKIEFLDFVPSDKRIAYAASLSVSMLPSFLQNKYELALGSFNSISVRESSAVNILTNLTARKISLVVDPVFLLPEKFWGDFRLAFAEDNAKKYILKYFIGNPCIDAKRRLDVWLKEGFDIIDLSLNSGGEWAGVSPCDFVALIRDAHAVITDSFHGVAFAIIFQREFYSFTREDPSSVGGVTRIISLLNQLGLMERLDCNSVRPRVINWQSVEDSLSEWRQSSSKYLVDNL